MEHNGWKMNRYGIVYRTVKDEVLNLDGFGKVEFAPADVVEMMYEHAQQAGFVMVWQGKEKVWKKVKK